MITLTLHSIAIRRAPRVVGYLHGWLSARLRSARAQRDLRVDREAFLNLLRVDDRALEDMGVTREDVAWAARLPLETNAALALRERAALQRERPRARPAAAAERARLCRGVGGPDVRLRAPGA